MKRLSRGNLKNLGERMATFIMNTMKDTSNFARARGIFGDDLMKAIITYSFIDSQIP